MTEFSWTSLTNAAEFPCASKKVAKNTEFVSETAPHYSTTEEYPPCVVTVITQPSNLAESGGRPIRLVTPD